MKFAEEHLISNNRKMFTRDKNKCISFGGSRRALRMGSGTNKMAKFNKIARNLLSIRFCLGYLDSVERIWLYSRCERVHKQILISIHIIWHGRNRIILLSIIWTLYSPSLSLSISTVPIYREKSNNNLHARVLSTGKWWRGDRSGEGKESN